LLTGVLANISVNAYLIDAIIALSVVYKALENRGALQSLGRWRPDTRWAVFVFGLFHGLGLSASLQELNLNPDGLLINLISFNVGVELGQLTALSMIVLGFALWRRHPGFNRMAFTSNTMLMCAGFTLMIYQLTAWWLNA
ncbi:MAG: HupE/UreJ family protein, partial [Pseudohongiella sp.]|nr:HupE/UreJ family protein [Pseudohongiella sp.]